MPVRGVRRRYLAIIVHSEGDVRGEDFFNSVKEKILFLYGVVGSSKMSYKPIDYKEKIVIIRCSHLWLQQMRTVIAQINQINGIKVSLQVLRISGINKTLKEKLEKEL